MGSASQSVFKTALAAVAVPYVVTAFPQTCKNAAEPAECLGVNTSFGEPACTWLMLKGRCTDAGGTEGKSSPGNCCASKASASSCEHRDAELQDGMCSLPLVGSALRRSDAAPSLDEMERMLHLSFAAYCSESQVNAWSCGEHCSAVSGISEPKYVFNSGYQIGAFVAWDSQAQTVLVVFRGTDNDSVESSVKNWAANLDFFKTSPLAQYPNAEVHEGFWGAWQALKADVVLLVQKLIVAHPTTSVRVTGHSLGGAVATNAAVDLKLNYGWSTSVVNFGSPRAGDHEYHNVISAEVPLWRVTHHNDIVAHVPPEAFGFYHGATELYFSEETGLTYKVCDGSGEDPSCANVCSNYLTCTSISDHLNYLDMGMSCASDVVIV